MQQLQGIFLRGRQHLDIQQWMTLADGSDRCQQARVVDVRYHADAQGAFQPLGQLQCMHLQLPELIGDHPCVGFQGLGHGGGPGFPVGAFEQGEAQLRFEVADRHAHCRRHSAQSPGGGGKRAAVEHGEK
ncbi:hypothetical protein D3C76_1344810 [compost metagenome]